jgi:hypothetical protein
MKKVLLLYFLLIAGLKSQAQLLNPGFEFTRTDGGASNWIAFVMSQWPCDDYAGWDSTYFQTTDAHSGNYALELRNAYCENTFFGGHARASEFDSIYSFIVGDPYSDRPESFSFYYKFFPEGGDKVQVTIRTGDDITTVADAEYFVSDAASVYTKLYIPLTYYISNNPTRVEMEFHIVNDTAQVHYGTKFQVDDINGETTGINEPHRAGSLVCYPTKATNELYVSTKDLNGDMDGMVIITDASGKMLSSHTARLGGSQPVKIDVSALPAGVFFVTLHAKGSTYTGRFIK